MTMIHGTFDDAYDSVIIFPPQGVAFSKPALRFKDIEPEPELQAITGRMVDQINGTLNDAYRDHPLPAGWHYEATFPPLDLHGTLPTHLTYTIEPVPDDPLVAALVLREE